VLNDGRLLLAGGCLPFTDARQGGLEDKKETRVGRPNSACRPGGTGRSAYRQRACVPQGAPVVSLTELSIEQCSPVRKVGAFAQGVLRTAVQAYHPQHVLCCTAFGALEHPSPKDYAYHRPCPGSSSHRCRLCWLWYVSLHSLTRKQASWSAGLN